MSAEAIPPCGASCPGECGYDPTDPNDPRAPTAYIYAVGYPANMVYDPTWFSEADVIGSFRGGYYVTDGGQVTGTLLRAVVGSDEWVEL